MQRLDFWETMCLGGVAPSRQAISEILRSYEEVPEKRALDVLAKTPTAKALADERIGLKYPLKGVVPSYRNNHFIAGIQDISELLLIGENRSGFLPIQVQEASLLLAVYDRLGAEERNAFLDLVAIARHKEQNPRIGAVGVFKVRKNH